MEGIPTPTPTPFLYSLQSASPRLKRHLDCRSKTVNSTVYSETPSRRRASKRMHSIEYTAYINVQKSNHMWNNYLNLSINSLIS